MVSQARQHFLHVPVWSSIAISADPSSPSCLNDIRAVLCSPLAAINSSRAAYGRIHSSTGCEVSCSRCMGLLLFSPGTKRFRFSTRGKRDSAQSLSEENKVLRW